MVIHEPTIGDVIGQVAREHEQQASRSGLTDDQVTVLLLLAEGFDYRQIGRHFHRSGDWARMRFYEIRDRLGGKNIPNTIHLAYQRGILKRGQQ
ncbi:MAG TPA: hypothetical protein VHV49_19235 [Pseudonocardiaceae bacterium]|nr:hypothetical protein [Pseudonocardiaceae bacterium]